MASFTERLQGIGTQLRNGDPPDSITVRAFLGWFGTQRRGYRKVGIIRYHLDKAGLLTDPDFEGAYIDSEIDFRLKPIAGSAAGSLAPIAASGAGTVSSVDGAVHLDAVAGSGVTALVGGGVADPTYRIGKLGAANRTPVSVKPDAPLQEAVTLMLLHDFSQLPVMQNERAVKGVISWQSVGSRLALQCAGNTVRDFTDTAVEVSADASLFAAIGAIIDRQYVLIRDSEQKISGIVTTSDLSLQFRQLAEPFLLLGEIENHIRRLLDGRFTIQEIKAACDPDDPDREVHTVADLTFGEYLRLLENPERWNKIGLAVDRSLFTKQLDRIREIRNDVMHFDPDGVAEEELLALRRFGQLLQTLQEVGAS